MAGHIFSKKELENILDAVVGRTLGEVDSKNVFARARKNPKITGIAGDVIEQSVLGYPADSYQECDLIVDGVDTELKTTGIRKPKKKSDYIYEAKEPMSITAVSPENIVHEEFANSKFWHKLENMLLVYYHYNSPTTVKALDYMDFTIEGYHFHNFDEEDKEILMNDWQIVRDFIRNLQEEYDFPEAEYPRISSELRKNLMMIDTAPKWPNRPRFRLKRATVSNIVQKHFAGQFEKLDMTFSNFTELDRKLHSLTDEHRGKTIKQLMQNLGMPEPKAGKGAVPKNISEQIVVKMFGGTSKKISKIDLFNKIGLIPKTITMNKKGGYKEDMKLFTIDFDEWTNKDIVFEDSFAFNYFNSLQFLCIIFEQQSGMESALENKFLGFKRLVLPEETIYSEVRPVWERIRYLVNHDELKEELQYDRDGQVILTPKTKIQKTALNFPKSKDHMIFVKGSGSDASKKTFMLNGIPMYIQNIWIRGKDINTMLSEIEFI